jgi:ferredoxin
MPNVSFEMESVTVAIPAGATIYDAAMKVGITLQRGFAEAHPCGGRGFCTGSACAVDLRSPDKAIVSAPTWKEKWLHRGVLKYGKRLACQASPVRDCTVVTIP